MGGSNRLKVVGLSFDRAYATQAVCGPSRLSVMAGLYPERTGLRSHDVKGWRQTIGDVPTLNAWLREHGYSTIGLGKVFHERDYERADGPNWTLWIDAEQEHYLLPESLRERQENRRRGKRVRGNSITMPTFPRMICRWIFPRRWNDDCFTAISPLLPTPMRMREFRWTHWSGMVWPKTPS